MFKTILDFLGDAIGVSQRGIRWLWDTICSQSAWILSAILTGCYALFTFLEWLVGTFTASMSRAVEAVQMATDGSILGSIPTQVLSGLAFVNTFFPVSETFSFVVTYYTLNLALVGYRTVKTWIPGS